MVLKYFVGGLIVFGIIVFTVKQIKSVIDAVRERRKAKSSEEVKKVDTSETPSEVSEKEVNE